MLPGPNIVIACPLCGALARYGTLLSGNTFGARIWSDGKQIARMLPRPPMFVLCHGCHEVYALRDAQEIGEAPLGPELARPEWESAPFVEEPDEAAYYAAIAKSDRGDADRHRSLRHLAWWRHNDPFRVDDDGVIPGESEDPRWRANAEALLSLLGDELNDQFMRVELLRQLGRSAEALAQLNAIEGPAEVKRALRALCESGDTQVRELRFQ
jgi:hypothetical protein